MAAAVAPDDPTGAAAWQQRGGGDDAFGGLGAGAGGGGGCSGGGEQQREIGGLAIWSVSSAKLGNGVELLRDGCTDTYWQSDGTQPHTVSIQFQKKVRIQLLALYLDYKQDESYTPNRISVRAGNSLDTFKEVKVVELQEPCGWVRVPLQPDDQREYLTAFCMQVAVLSNHQNGRDTHIRQINVFGPRQNVVQAGGVSTDFKTPNFTMYSSIR